MRLNCLFLITATATSAIVAHPVVEDSENSRISERDDLSQEFSMDDPNDQLFANNLASLDSGGGSDDNMFSANSLDASPDLSASALPDDSQTYIVAENDASDANDASNANNPINAGCATNPDKRDLSDVITSEQSTFLLPKLQT